MSLLRTLAAGLVAVSLFACEPERRGCASKPSLCAAGEACRYDPASGEAFCAPADAGTR